MDEIKLMTISEYHTFIESKGAILNGLDKFLEGLDGIIDDFISNFYDTKVICGLAEPLDLSSISEGYSLTLGKLQLSPTRIACLHLDIPEGEEVPEGMPADGVDYYQFEFYMWDNDHDRYRATASSLLLNNVCVFNGHIMCTVFLYDGGYDTDVPDGTLSVSIDNSILNAPISIPLTRYTQVCPDAGSATVDISLVVQGTLASATPVDVTIDIPVIDGGGGDEGGGGDAS